jgi:hypothetical protein
MSFIPTTCWYGSTGIGRPTDMVLIVCRRHDRICERTTAPDGTPRIACPECIEEIAVEPPADSDILA